MKSLKLLAVSFIFVLSSAVFSTAQTTDPQAAPAAVVSSGQARFSVLTPHLIRMEWSANSAFEDRPSLVFTNRHLPVPEFSRKNDGEGLRISTNALTLRYKINSGIFTPQNLRVTFRMNGKDVEWKPGMKDTANLGGTIRTLDGVEGPTELDAGLCSRDGWVVVDDSKRPLFDSSEWPWVFPRPDSGRLDWYLFAYGHDYRQELYDFTRVAGRIPMPPRFAFGYWWSRYWAYTDTEFKQLVDEFEQHDVPIDVLVVDMDWHKTFNLRWDRQPKDQAGQSLGWTGYTWDSLFFPDPVEFLSWCGDHGLKTPLNLHPASGIQPHEEHYPEMARSMGIDPSTKKYVPFDIVDKKFATNYLDNIIHPLEKEGVDFWWLDWQQWGTTNIPGVTPTWWLNYVFFTDMERRGESRPLLFHRWGGLGNHRYQIGFSGDVISVWPSLAFQPYFTSTAANVGYGYWSHDIGGHMPGVVSPELYTRWIQFGIFSPILRTHTTKNVDSERRIWAYPPDYYNVMRDAFLLRYALVPYLYTESRMTYETGTAICHPLYYDYPEAPEAYGYRDEYLFGSKMLVAPVTSPVDSTTQLARKKIWIPPGEWYEWYTGMMLHGPAVVERAFQINQIPVYLRAGSIIPMAPPMNNTHEKPVDPLIITIAPGDSGSYKLYDDAGNTNAYRKGEYAQTSMNFRMDRKGMMKVHISGEDGTYPGMPLARGYELRCLGQLPPESVILNGSSVPFSPDGKAPGWRYDGENLAVVVAIPSHDAAKPVDCLLQFIPPNLPERNLLNGFPGRLARMNMLMKLVNHQWPKDWSPDPLVDAAQTGNRLTLFPSMAADEIKRFDAVCARVRAMIPGLEIDSSVKAVTLKLLDVR